MQINIFDYGMNGEGVGKIDGKIALVPHALEDEIVDAEIEADHGNYCTMKVEKIVAKSSQRVQPPCPYFYECGGCALQHMSYAEQLKFKTLLVKKTIKKIAGLDLEVAPCVASQNDFNYRNKMSFVFGQNKIGFFKFNSKEIVDVKNCKLASENINKVLTLARDFFLDKPYLNDLKFLVVREIENQLLVGVVAKKFLEIGNFYAKLQQNFKNIGLFLIKNARNDAVVLTNNCTHIGGIKQIETHNFGLTYFVDLLGFQQTNIDVQNKIYARVLELIGQNKNIINGFSGNGLLSAIVAQKAKFVWGIEINKSAHLASEALKQQNNIKNLKNICGDFNIEFPKLKTADILIVDPAKKGLDKKVLTSLVGVKKIVYISCNPIALAKDLRYLKNYYIIEHIEPFDMFPQTNSVETLVDLKLK